MDSEIHVVKANDFRGSEEKILSSYIETMTFKKLLEY
jgi:hypothetical protein